MAKSEHQMPQPNRSSSEIDFVLRRAKRRHGPSVLRDLARAETEDRAEPAPRGGIKAPGRGRAAR